MRVLMIVQQVDERHWLRGFTVGWIRALATHVEHLHVLTLELSQPEVVLPGNVTLQSMGKELGHGRWQELRAFYGSIGRIIREVDVIFSHMTPRYTWLAAPYAAFYRKPQMLWFTHRKDSLELRAALATARWATTATADSFPIASRKVHVMGHGIDEARFSPLPDEKSAKPPLVLAVGRISPIKHHHILLETAATLRDKDVRFAVAGETAAPGDEDYKHDLLKRRDALGLTEEQFNFLGPLASDELIAHYRRAAIVTNLSPAGLFDKAALEAMLTATPLIAASSAFDDLLGEHRRLLRVSTPDDVAALTAQLTALLALSDDERHQIGMDLRQRTAAAHGLDRLMQKMVTLMAGGVQTK